MIQIHWGALQQFCGKYMGATIGWEWALRDAHTSGQSWWWLECRGEMAGSEIHKFRRQSPQTVDVEIKEKRSKKKRKRRALPPPPPLTSVNDHSQLQFLWVKSLGWPLPLSSTPIDQCSKDNVFSIHKALFNIDECISITTHTHMK